MAKSGPAVAGETSPPAGDVADPAAEQTPPPATPAPRWRYIDVERILADHSLHVSPGDVYEGEQPPGHPDWWVPTDEPAVMTAAANPRGAWTPEELAAGALREDWPADGPQVKEINGD